MFERGSIGGLVLIIIGLVIVIVQALNMNNLFRVEDILRSLGLVLIGVAVQLLGLGVMLVSKIASIALCKGFLRSGQKR